MYEDGRQRQIGKCRLLSRPRTLQSRPDRLEELAIVRAAASRHNHLGEGIISVLQSRHRRPHRMLDEQLSHLRSILSEFQDMSLTISEMKNFLGFPSIERLGQHVDGMEARANRQVELPAQRQRPEERERPGALPWPHRVAQVVHPLLRSVVRTVAKLQEGHLQEVAGRHTRKMELRLYVARRRLRTC